MATRLIDLPFTRGLDESVDETVAALPAMTELTNYRLTRAGRLEHRLGVQEIGLLTSLNDGTGAQPDFEQSQAVYGRTLIAGGHAYTALGFGEWACNGSVSRFVPFDSTTALAKSGTSYSHQSCASVFGYLVVIGTNNEPIPRIDVKIIEEVTGKVAWFDTVGIITGAAPNNRGRVVACGNTAVIVFQNLDTGAIFATSRDLSVFPFADFPTESVIVGSSVSYGFDAAAVDSSRYVIAHYISTTGRIDMRQLDATTHIPQVQIDFVAGASYVTCLYDAGFYYLAWCDTAANVVRAAVYQHLAGITFTQVGSTQTLATGVTEYFRPVLCRNGFSNGVYVGFTEGYTSGSFSTYMSTFVELSSASVTGTTYGPIYNYWIASKPFVSSSVFVESQRQPSVWLANYNVNDTETDRSYFLVTIPVGTVVPTGAHTGTRPPLEMSASPSAAMQLPASDYWQPCEVVETTGTVQRYWQTALLETFRGAGTVNPQNRVQAYRFGDAARSLRARSRCIVECQGSIAVLGGAPRYFDGAWMTEIGIPHGPTIVDATPDTGGSMTASATYRYVAVLEYYDARGQRQLSYVSSPYSVTMGVGQGEVFLEIAVPSIWAASNAFQVPDPRSVSLRLYRTAANVGTVFRFTYSSGSIPSSPNGSPAGPYSSQVSIIDATADVDIAANEAIYVQVGNALSNYRAPPCRFGCEHEGRLIVAGGWKPNEFYCSKLFFAGEGVQFTESASFVGVCPEPITGMASLDGSLVLFGERAIYTVTGDGPLDDGTGSFSTPRRLPGRIGCTDWRSVVTVPDGVFFRSLDGIYLLPRGLASASFIGAAIKEALRDFPETLAAATCTRAIASSVNDHDSEQVVAWLVGNAEAPTSVAIFVLSLSTNSWSRISLPTENGNPYVVMGVWSDLTNSTDVLAFAREDLNSNTVGTLVAENPGSGYDQDISDSFEPLLAGAWKTGKIFPFGFGGRGSIRSIRIVGHCLASTTLTPTIYSSDNEAGYASSSLTFTAGRFAVEIPFRRHDITWIQIQVADPTTGSGNRGAGLRFNGLALEVEMEAGLHRSTTNERST